MEFSKELEAWLSAAFASGVSDEVLAFSFNLIELDSSDPRFVIELIGAPDYDPDDPDWACDEVWVPAVRSLAIPRAFSGDTWEECLSNTKTLLLALLDGGGALAAQLKAGQAVALGFVDGDLEPLWQG